jgi:hypothetical protein
LYHDLRHIKGKKKTNISQRLPITAREQYIYRTIRKYLNIYNICSSVFVLAILWGGGSIFPPGANPGTYVVFTCEAATWDEEGLWQGRELCPPEGL